MYQQYSLNFNKMLKLGRLDDTGDKLYNVVTKAEY
jgi:hypothetical protein